MHRLKNRVLGIALGGAAVGGFVFTGAASASAATLTNGGRLPFVRGGGSHRYVRRSDVLALPSRR